MNNMNELVSTTIFGTTQAAITQRNLNQNSSPVVIKLPLSSGSDLVSDETFAMFSTIVNEWLCLVLASIGIVNSVICIVVFAVQGYKDTVNITMTTIAFWDVIKLLCAVVARLYGPISLVNAAFGKSWENITFINIGYFQGIAGNISYIMAGYVAIERSLCVSVPFDVKRLLTPKTTKIISISISLTVFGSLVPVLFIFEIVWVYSKNYGGQIAVYTYSKFYDLHGAVFMKYYKLMAFLYPMISLFTMIISTCVIVFRLHQASKFRLKGASTNKAQDHGSGTGKNQGRLGLTARDTQVVKLLLVVILVYISILLPRFIHFMVSLIIPEYYVLKQYNNIFWCDVYLIYVLDYLNASSLLFIYFTMSSNFRGTFRHIFRPPCVYKKP